MQRFIKSVRYALCGWRLFFSKEKNGQIQFTVAILTIILSFLLHLSSTEWIIILLCTIIVISLEMINSVIEKLLDHLHPAHHEQVQWVKDVAAGSVLWAALISAVIGSIIFIPKMIHLF
mgnify:CR=1 FL=1